MSLLPRPFGRSNPKKMLVESHWCSPKRKLILLTTFSPNCQVWRCLWCWLCGWISQKHWCTDHGRENDHLQYVHQLGQDGNYESRPYYLWLSSRTGMRSEAFEEAAADWKTPQWWRCCDKVIQMDVSDLTLWWPGEPTQDGRRDFDRFSVKLRIWMMNELINTWTWSPAKSQRILN